MPARRSQRKVPGGKLVRMEAVCEGHFISDIHISGDFFVQQTNTDDYQLGISFGRSDVNGTHDVWLWQPTKVAGARSQVKVDSTRNESEHLTRVEAIIPWSLFGGQDGREVKPEE